MRSSRLIKWCMALALAVSASVSTAAIASPVSHAASHTAPYAATAKPVPVGAHGGVATNIPSRQPFAKRGTGASYCCTPVPTPTHNLVYSVGAVMPSLTIYYDFWLGTDPSATYAYTNSTPNGNYVTTNASYENTLIRFAQDLGGSQYHNLLTQYYGTNGTISNTVNFGGSWVDTTDPYGHTGSQNDPLTDTDIWHEVIRAAGTNGWTVDASHIVAVFTATGMNLCGSSTSCTFPTSPDGSITCAYHSSFSDLVSNLTYIYAAMPYNFCDQQYVPFPNDQVADGEIELLSHELMEAQTDPYGNQVLSNGTWSYCCDSKGNSQEIGDVCNLMLTPQNSNGADVYLNGHPYIVQEGWSNASSTCAVDLPTNGFCAGSVSHVCAPTTAYSETVSNGAPTANTQVTYTLSLYNSSNTAAETNLTITDTLPSGYTINNVTADPLPSVYDDGTYYIPPWTSSSVTVTYDTLPIHQQVNVKITATVSTSAVTNCGALAGHDLLNTALSSLTTSPCATTTPTPAPGACPQQPNDFNCDNQDYSAQGCNSYPQSQTYSSSILYVQLYYSTNCQSNWTFAEAVASGYVLHEVWIEREETIAYAPLNYSDVPEMPSWHTKMVWAPVSPTRSCASYKNLSTGAISGAYCTAWSPVSTTCKSSPSDAHCTGQDYVVQGCNAYAQTSPAPYSNAYVTVTDYYSTNCQSNWAVAKLNTTDPDWTIMSVTIKRGAVSGGLGATSKTANEVRGDTTWWSYMVYAPSNPTQACVTYMDTFTFKSYTACTSMA